MLTTHQKAILTDLEREVKVKGARVVAEELEISESAVRELAPEESRKHDEAHANR